MDPPPCSSCAFASQFQRTVVRVHDVGGWVGWVGGLAAAGEGPKSPQGSISNGLRGRAEHLLLYPEPFGQPPCQPITNHVHTHGGRS